MWQVSSINWCTRWMFGSLYNHIINFRKGMLEWSDKSEGTYINARKWGEFKPI